MNIQSYPRRRFTAKDDESFRRQVCKSGSSLLMVMFLLMVVSLLLGTLYFNSSQRIFTLKRETNRMKALAIAEAGLGDAFSQLAADHSLASNEPMVLNNDFSQGAYTVSASVPSGANDGVILLTATGTYRGQRMQSMATVLLESAESEEEEDSSDAVVGPFGPVALLAGQDLSFSGGVQVNLQELGVHANGNMSFSGGPDLWAGYASTNGSLSMNGNPVVTLGDGEGLLHANGPVTLYGRANMNQISSSTSITGNWGVSTSAVHIAPIVNYPKWFSNPPTSSYQNVTPVEPMELPELDVEAFKTYAQTYDFYFEGTQNINRSWLTKLIKERTGEKVNNQQTLVIPDGGVMFVNGDVKLSSDMDFEGVLIATGDVQILGAATFANPTGYPAVVSVYGDIQVGGGSSGLSVDGWIYAMNGSVTLSGGASGMTGVIAAQDIEIKGGYSIGDADEIKAITWPGKSDGADDGGAGGTGTLRLISWIR